MAKDGTTAALVIGASIMYINGEEKALDTAVQIINGRTMVPVRTVREAFGVNVGWNGESKTLTITQ